MSIVVNTNLSSLITQRSLFKAGSTVTSEMTKLSTGLRINSAADDAAGLSLAQKMSTQVNASDIAKRNAQTGINMIQTAEADMGTIQENLQKMRDLAVQSANGVYSSSERDMLQAEYQNRLREIDRISKSSSFSGTKLLDGTTGSMILQIGTNNSSNDQIDVSSIFKNYQAGNNSIPATTVTISTASLAQAQITIMDAAISATSVARSSMGATINRLQGTISRIDTRKENMVSSRSVIQDADIAKESAEYQRSNILQQTATAMLTQANQLPSLALRLLQ